MTLSPLSPSALNSRLPSPFTFDISENSPFELPAHKMAPGRIVTETFESIEDELRWEEDTSSPFVTELNDVQRVGMIDHEDTQLDLDIPSSPSPSKSSVGTRKKASTSFEICEDDTASMPPPSTIKSRALSPFKVAVSTPKLSSPNKQLFAETMAQERSVGVSETHSSQTTTSRQSNSFASHTETFRAESVRKTQVFHTANASLEESDEAMIDVTNVTFMTAEPEPELENVDDSCFSAFSEVPNMDMTKFAQLNGRGVHGLSSVDQTPRAVLYSSKNTPNTHRTMRATSRTPSPTPTRRTGAQTSENDTTNLLLDFTQQFEALSTVTQRLRAASRRSMSPMKASNGTLAEPQLLSYLNSQRSPRKGAAMPSTPSSKNLLTLLDFELPPAPTPRSVPSISIREMESLKSNYASQISALKATLSGREAEVEALKRAVSDAERRVGEAAEGLREEKSKRECIEREKEEWERRGTEFEDVLKRVKKEVMESEKEKQGMERRAEEAEERTHELESRLAEAEERAARAEREKVDASVMIGVGDGGSELNGPLFTAEQVQKQIDEKVHALSTELHAIYKKKHITKVAGLKKGFESKTKEKTMELAAKIEELERHNDELQGKLDGTLSGVIPAVLAVPGLERLSSEQREAELKKMEEQQAMIERQKAELAGREEELKTQRNEYSTIMAELERERVEKGELVAAVDEMLALQADVSVLNIAAVNAEPPSSGPAVEDVLRKSAGLAAAAAARPSGLARPGFGFGQSRIGAPSGLAKPVAGKSRMMSNIERMGGGRSVE